MKTAQTDTSKGSILIVDDTPINLRLLAEILARQGYEVRPTPKGEYALLSARLAPPDVILLDIKMPEMDGYTVCEQLKADARTRDIPVIFISALNDVLDKVKAFGLGGVDYITKPFQAEEVLARVATHLTLRNLQKRLQESNHQLQQEIAERTRVAQELVKHQDHLEELVVQRTLEVQKSNVQLHAKNLELQQSQEALQRAKEAVEAANHAKSEFIANISHELRTPLNIILGYTQLLQHEPNLTAEQQETLHTIQHSGDHLLLMLNDILDLATLEAGKLSAEAAAFAFPPFLRDLAQITRIQANLQGIAFNYDAAPDLPGWVTADAKRLRQVLLNLLGNAIKFTPHGAVTFKVSSFDSAQDDRVYQKQAFRQEQKFISSYPERSRRAQPATRIRFEVEDTGIGIPPEQLQKIFAAFHQVESKWTARAEGLGLGLTVSQRLVRMMGSELQVRSTLGAGSTFWFDLALPEETAAALCNGTNPYESLVEVHAPTTASQTPLDAQQSLPPPEELHVLLNLAMDGDIMALQEQVKRLQAQEPQATPFVTKLAEYVKTYQIGKIQQFLRQAGAN